MTGNSLRYTLAMTVWRPPLRAFYLALLLLLLIAFYAQPRQGSLLFDEITEETVPGLYIDEPLPERDGFADGGVTDDAAAEFAAAPPPQPAVRWLEYRVRRGDTMDRVLRAIHADAEIRNYLLQQKMETYRKLRIGSIVYFQQDSSGRLQEMLYKTSPQYYFKAGRDALGRLWAKEEPPETETVRYMGAGLIDSSLYAATAAAGMSNIASDRLVQVLETQIDFYRQTRQGDSFRVIYDTQRDEYGDEVAVGDIDIVAFEYDSKLEARPRRIRGVYYQNGDISGYYTPDGENLQRAFLPAPLKYRRISSRFTNRRFHPVLKRWRPHRGVDYAAPSGTPVHATADGVVTRVDRQRGYGNVVMIKHFNIYTTVYAHLRGFRKGIRRGKHVKQGEVIGYVGQTGLSTGPHLHYEFRVRGKHKDPLSEVIPKQLPPLKGEALENYKRHSAPIFAELDQLTVQQRV